MLERALQRIYCFLHTCDVLGKRYFKFLDGKSSGPKSLKGPIGKRIGGDDLRFKQIIEFQPIKTTLQGLPAEVEKKLSQDYKYFYRITKAVATGSEYFNNNKAMITASPGPLFESRWLTIFNRCCRDYVSTVPGSPESTDKQRKMVTFIVQVLAPAWFHAIAHPSFVDGPRSLHKLVTAMAKFGEENFREDEDGDEDDGEDDSEDEDQNQDKEEDEAEEAEEKQDEDEGC